MTTPPRVGVLALQGDVREHARVLTDLGAEVVKVRRPQELAEVDGLVLPGGVANADAIRTDSDAVTFVRELAAKAPVAVICHGPWILAEAGAIDGRTLTSWPSLKTDLENAGAHWVDEQVHVDGSLVSSRKPDDLPAFCNAMLEAFAAGEPAVRRTGAAA